jgi:hypothetical protein
VDDCDVFFGIISPHYGSGRDEGNGPSITHQELLRAVEKEKPRWMLAHENVVLSRRLLLDLGFNAAKRSELKSIKRGGVIDDLRLIEMYETATREDLPVSERTGSWVQKYGSDEDVLRYVAEQFGSEAQVRAFLAPTPEAQNVQKAKK